MDRSCALMHPNIQQDNNLNSHIQKKESRLEALQKAKTAGQHFFATGGSHLNTDDFFRARALTERQERVEQLEAEKKELLAMKNKCLDCLRILQTKGEWTFATSSSFTVDEEKKVA